MKTKEEAVEFCKYVHSQIPYVGKYEGYTFESYMNHVFLANKGYEDFFIKIYDEYSPKGVGLYRYSEVMENFKDG